MTIYKRLYVYTFALSCLTVLLFIGCEKENEEKKAPTVTTIEITEITDISAKSGGTIVSSNGTAIISQGVCWNTTNSPTTSDNKTVDVLNGINYTSNINGLAANTRYYVRAYATSADGTAYGSEKSFQTKSSPIDIATTDITGVTVTSAVGGGNISNNGGVAITAKGVVWSTSQNPTTSSNMGMTTNGTGTGAFTSNLNGLQANTTYYVRAYATNANGTAYGSEKSFKTLIGTINISTSEPILVTAVSAMVGGNISSNGGSAITSRGVVWSTSQNPTTTINMGITNTGTGTGGFMETITGLQANTTYYVKTYATNASGTVYGEQKSFQTLNGVISITTTDINNITATSAFGGGNITSDGGATITTRGMVWSTSQNPTTSSNAGITSDGTGTGYFTSNLTGLTHNTTYYARAYATNSVETYYGNQVTFKTSIADGPGATITDASGNVYNTIWINGKQWMKENLKTTKYNDATTITLVTDNTAWSNLSTPAYCWHNNQASNGNTYGALYNWYTVNTGKLCPTGWHIPSDEEWTELTNYLGGESIAGGKLKKTGTTHWWEPNTGATNEKDFTALPGSSRAAIGTFNNSIGMSGGWWSSTEESTSYSWYRSMSYNENKVFRANTYKRQGLSVRCVKN